jgi:ATP-binding cassette subfamily B protein
LARVAAANRIVESGVAFDTRVAGVQNLVGAGARVAVIAVGALLITRGEVTLGTIVAFMGYVGGVFGPIQTLTGVYGTVRRASAAMAEVFDVLDRQDHVIEHTGAKELSHVTGTVRFEGVHFSYDGRAPVLGGIDLTAQAGEHIAIVGPSGGGKTTLMALLQRFHDPNQGRITIDGVNLVDLKRGSLRRNIAVVLQDPVLFNDTVAANIAYGRPGATRAEIESAARAAEAHEFVSALRGGYDALVGERGQLLSMGQRQRIAIARAILKHAPIVILDEATSALDSVSEAAVQQALRRLIQGRTTFTIAHRLATVVGADRIIVIRGGRISEEGSHAELVARNGYYAQLVSHQLRGLLDDAA